MDNPRSCLSVPGSSERMIAKAIASPADEVVLDLEDAVAPPMKCEARSLVVRALASAPEGRRIAVRVNAVRTQWCHDDLIALATAQRRPDSVIIPKSESAGDLAFVERLLDGLDAASPGPVIQVQALIESALGLRDAAAIAASSRRLEALVIGYADLAASLSREPTAVTWAPAREHVLWAARAAGLRAVDGPHLGIGVDGAFEQSLMDAVASGYDGKWVIHPAQIDTVNEAFSPTETAVSWAQRVVDALATAADAGHGAVALDGVMLDEAVALGARRVLARVGGQR